MHILILGATGATGLAVVRQALASLSESSVITLYVRNPLKIPEEMSSNPAVDIIEGQLDDQPCLEKAMEGVDAVISALGPVPPFHPFGTPLARAYERILAAMRVQNVKRILLLGTTSIPDAQDRFSVIFYAISTVVATVIRTTYNDIVEIGKVMQSEKGKDIDWIIVRVPLLTNEDRTDVVAGYIGDGKTGTYLSRAGFGAFVVSEIEERKWVHKMPLITTS